MSSEDLSFHTVAPYFSDSRSSSPWQFCDNNNDDDDDYDDDLLPGLYILRKFNIPGNISKSWEVMKIFIHQSLVGN